MRSFVRLLPAQLYMAVLAGMRDRSVRLPAAVATAIALQNVDEKTASGLAAGGSFKDGNVRNALHALERFAAIVELERAVGLRLCDAIGVFDAIALEGARQMRHAKIQIADALADVLQDDDIACAASDFEFLDDCHMTSC
jgi:hypothetical protein